MNIFKSTFTFGIIFLMSIAFANAELQVVSTILSINASNGSASVDMSGGNSFSFQCNNTQMTQNLSVIKDITCQAQNNNVTECQSNLENLSKYFNSYAQNCSKWYDHQSVVAGYSNCSDNLDKERVRSTDLQNKYSSCAGTASALELCQKGSSDCTIQKKEVEDGVWWKMLIEAVVLLGLAYWWNKKQTGRSPTQGLTQSR